MKNLAQIVKIKEIKPIKDADKIEIAKVLLYDVIVKKNQYNVGDLAVFVFPDTIIPKKYLDLSYTGNEKIKLKTIKMRGQISHGLLIPISVAFSSNQNFNITEGLDVTELLGIEKYEKPIPFENKEILCNFPTSLVSKTDEINYKSSPSTINEFISLGEEPVCVTVKYDGTSSTFLNNNGEFFACSRNYALKRVDNIYWKVAKKFRLENIIMNFEKQIAIQGEICAPNINSGISSKELMFYCFLIRDISENRWFSWNETLDFCEKYNIPTVQEIFRFPAKNLNINELQKIANELNYSTGKPAEGIVFRTVNPIYSKTLAKSWISLKAISDRFSLKYE